MYKNLSIALLLVVFGLVAGHSVAKSDSAVTSPVIVKRVALQNQSAAIPSTTLFTPSQNGLFRVSVYMSQTTLGEGAVAGWTYSLTWTDDAGAESSPLGIMSVNSNNAPPLAWGTFVGVPGQVVLLEGIGGQPISYSVALNSNGSVITPGAYSLYFVVERLM